MYPNNWAGGLSLLPAADGRVQEAFGGAPPAGGLQGGARGGAACSSEVSQEVGQRGRMRAVFAEREDARLVVAFRAGDEAVPVVSAQQ